MLGIMSLPTAQDGNAAQMLAGMQMLQAPEFLQQIAAGMPVLSDDDDQPSIEELMRQANEKQMAGIQSLLDQYGQSEPTMTSDDAYTQQPNLMLNDSAMSKYGAATTLAPLLMGTAAGLPITGLGLGALGIYDKFTSQIPMIDERLQEADPEGYQEMMDDPGGAFLYNVRPMYSLADGGSVSTKIDDNYKSLQLADEDTYLKGEMLGDEDPLYNYTLGLNLSDIMPGLSAEFGIRDDAIMEPGMMSPDDEKFFKLLYNF